VQYLDRSLLLVTPYYTQENIINTHGVILVAMLSGQGTRSKSSSVVIQRRELISEIQPDLKSFKQKS